MDMLKSILHLILGSASMAVSWMGSTFLAVAVLAAPFISRLFVGFRANRWHGVIQALRSASIYTIAVWAILFLIGVGRFIYRDHTSYVTANTALKRANKELSSQKSANVTDSQFAISFDNEYASISNIVQAFRMLMPQQSKMCWAKITAPRENRQIAQVLSSLGATFCRVDAPYDPAEPDDEALRGSLKDTILVHMKKTVPDRSSFVTALGNVFSVRRTYDLPSGSPDELVWIQIGQGNPWRKDPTKPGTD